MSLVTSEEAKALKRLEFLAKDRGEQITSLGRQLADAHSALHEVLPHWTDPGLVDSTPLPQAIRNLHAIALRLEGQLTKAQARIADVRSQVLEKELSDLNTAYRKRSLLCAKLQSTLLSLSSHSPESISSDFADSPGAIQADGGEQGPCQSCKGTGTSSETLATEPDDCGACDGTGREPHAD